MSRIILSLGGSIIFPETINISFLKEFKAFILDQVSKGKQFIIICGGGGINKQYNAAVRDIVPDIDNESLDWVGISATAMNAFFVRVLFGEHAHPELLGNPTENIQTDKSIIVGHGWKPGCSTDKDAVLAAQTFGAETVINLTNVEYVYDKDPKKHEDAKKIEHISWSELRALIGDKWTPKLDFPFDPSAAKLGQELKLKVIIAQGTDLENLGNVIEGNEFKGTSIGPE